MTLIAHFGVGGWISSPWYQKMLVQSQMPGVKLLVQMGLCCGI